MKKILLTLVALVIVLGLFTATGYAGYRIGYAQGMERTADGQAPAIRPFDERGTDRIPIPNWGDRFDRGSHREFRPGGFPMRGFGFFAPLRFL
jgi:hypothetical protein